MKLKEVIPKFKYLKLLGEIDVRQRLALTQKFLEVVGQKLNGGSVSILVSAGSPTKWGFIHKSVS